VITIPDARSECEDFGSPAIGREYDRTLSWRIPAAIGAGRYVPHCSTNIEMTS
jgi:hypothetical protein